MSDRELLEAAARAAGIRLVSYNHSTGACGYEGSGGRWWSPLTDDGDRYRLARRLGLRIDFVLQEVQTPDLRYFTWGRGEDDEAHAIVRAAAACAPKAKP